MKRAKREIWFFFLGLSLADRPCSVGLSCSFVSYFIALEIMEYARRGQRIALRTVSKNGLHHQRPPHDSDKNYSPVESFV